MYKSFWRVLIAACLLGIAAAVPAASVDAAEGRGMARNAIQSGDDLMDSIYTDCLRKDSVNCVKYKLFAFVDKMIGSKDSIPLADGVTVVKTQAANDGSPRSLDEEKNEDVETMVESRVERFLSSHTLKFDVKGSDIMDSISSAGRALSDATDYLGITETDAAEESRGKKKKAAKILLPLLLALKLKAAALIPLALGAIALIAGKALVIGKIALVLAAIIGLKKLLSQQKSVTYEIVSHPHHSSSSVSSGHDAWSGGDYSSSASGASHGGWARSANDPQDLAYRAYKPQQQ